MIEKDRIGGTPVIDSGNRGDFTMRLPDLPVFSQQTSQVVDLAFKRPQTTDLTVSKVRTLYRFVFLNTASEQR